MITTITTSSVLQLFRRRLSLFEDNRHDAVVRSIVRSTLSAPHVSSTKLLAVCVLLTDSSVDSSTALTVSYNTVDEEVDFRVLLS